MVFTFIEAEEKGQGEGKDSSDTPDNQQTSETEERQTATVPPRKNIITIIR